MLGHEVIHRDVEPGNIPARRRSLAGVRLRHCPGRRVGAAADGGRAGGAVRRRWPAGL